jgi:hypothetical protein
MLLWTRTRQVDVMQGPQAFAFAVDMARHAATTTGLEVVPWTSVYGLPIGTVVYSVQVESQAAMATALTTIAADDGYQRLIAESGRTLYMGPGEDAIGELVSAAGHGESTGAFANVILAQCAPGHIAEATAWGVDILSQASKVTGLSGSFFRSLYGPWATLVWISLAESMEEVDDAAAALAGDATYIERIDDAGPLFIPGSASQRLLRRLG